MKSMIIFRKNSDSIRNAISFIKNCLILNKKLGILAMAEQ